MNEKIKTIVKQINFLKMSKGDRLKIQRLQQKLDAIISKENGRNKTESD